MLNKNNQPGQRTVKKKPVYLPLTIEELEFMQKKRFIDENDLMRLLGICESTMYKLIRNKQLVPAWLGSKKMFDMEDIYERLKESKGRGRGPGEG